MSRTVKVKKSDLLETLRKNKAEHVEAFDLAYKAWVTDMTVAVDKLNGAPINDELLKKVTSVWQNKPKTYADSYVSAIKQMEMEIRDEIDLELHEFDELVCDQWDWQRNFTSNTYSSMSSSLVKSR